MDHSPSPSSLPSDYPRFLASLKERIRSARVKATLSVNRELILLYWDLGREVVQRQKRGNWGTRIVDQLCVDIREEFQGINGFSRTNVHRMGTFYRAWAPIFQQLSRRLENDGAIHQQPAGILGITIENKADSLIVPQAVGQLPPTTLTELPWGHNLVLIESLKQPSERLWYAKMAVEHGWSRSILIRQIESRLHLRQGKAQTNFAQTLPASQAAMAQELMKGEYALDFLTASGSREQDIERGIIDNLQKSLLELGKGFSFTTSI